MGGVELRGHGLTVAMMRCWTEARCAACKAYVPTIAGQDLFKGEQQHSSQHSGPDAYTGKKVVVIGANNSAHDICAALSEHGADVTMV